jgi:TM2 domain-containing membrane protein YozV
MYCRNCGKEINKQAIMCIYCGVAPNNGDRYCQNCGNPTNSNADICVKCGVMLSKISIPTSMQKSKLTAGLLGIFIGGLGVHRFYLGYTGIGVAQLILALFGIFTCGITTIAAHIWGLIEGIMILTGSINKDSDGNSLRN